MDFDFHQPTSILNNFPLPMGYTTHESYYFFNGNSGEVYDAIELFRFYNLYFFHNVLEASQVKWSARMTMCAGTCKLDGVGSCLITLSEPLLKFRTSNELKETLIHEMIHAYLFITNPKACRDHGGHGVEFCEIMDNINKMTGLKISVYHNFHDEVLYYKKHIWKCSGPCQTKKPYFGICMRAMNRTPGEKDFWYKRHQMECGGTFIKIEGPEFHPEENKKGDKGKDKKSANPRKRKAEEPVNTINNYLKKPKTPDDKLEDWKEDDHVFKDWKEDSHIPKDWKEDDHVPKDWKEGDHIPKDWKEDDHISKEWKEGDPIPKVRIHMMTKKEVEEYDILLNWRRRKEATRDEEQAIEKALINNRETSMNPMDIENNSNSRPTPTKEKKVDKKPIQVKLEKPAEKKNHSILEYIKKVPSKEGPKASVENIDDFAFKKKSVVDKKGDDPFFSLRNEDMKQVERKKQVENMKQAEKVEQMENVKRVENPKHEATRANEETQQVTGTSEACVYCILIQRSEGSDKFWARVFINWEYNLRNLLEVGSLIDPRKKFHEQVITMYGEEMSPINSRLRNLPIFEECEMEDKANGLLFKVEKIHDIKSAKNVNIIKAEHFPVCIGASFFKEDGTAQENSKEKLITINSEMQQLF